MDLTKLLQRARSSDKKERKNAASEMGDLEYKYPEALAELQRLKEDDSDRGVRKEAEKALKKLEQKPAPPVAEVKTRGGTAGTAFDDEIGDKSLRIGEFDYESSLSTEEERAIDAMHEGKGLVLEIKEKQRMVLDSLGVLKEANPIEGEVKVLNNGTKDRIFGIDLRLDNFNKLEEIEGETEFAEEIGIVDLDPNETWVKHYKFETEEEPIKVKVNYVDKETGLLPNFLGKERVLFSTEIEITNTKNEDIENLMVIKHVSKNATVEDASSSMGDVTVEDSKVKLKVDKIPSGETIKFVIDLNGSLPEGEEAYEAEQIEISYDRPQLLSGLEFKGIDGVSNHRQSLKRQEREEEPGVYDCVVYFENKSEFPYDLNTLKVFEGDIGNQTLVLDWDGTQSTEEEREVQPGEKIAFEFAFEYDGEGAPTFGRIVDFTVQGHSHIYTHTELVIPPEKLKFMALAVQKTYELKQVPSYRKTSVPTLVKVIGVGTYPLEALIVKDTIPSGFEAPEKDEIQVFYNGEELKDGYEVKGAVGDKDNITAEKVLEFHFEHLEENSDIGGFKENDIIELKYPVTVVRPTKDQGILKGGVVAEGFIYANPDQKVISSVEDEIEGIQVVHERIAINVSKELIATRTSEGKGYEITLYGENYGNKAVTFTLKDLIPKGFRIVGETREEPPVIAEDVKTSDDGVEKLWTFENVPPQSEVKVNYTIVGEGKYNPRDAQVLAQG